MTKDDVVDVLKSIWGYVWRFGLIFIAFQLVTLAISFVLPSDVSVAKTWIGSCSLIIIFGLCMIIGTLITNRVANKTSLYGSKKTVTMVVVLLFLIIIMGIYCKSAISTSINNIHALKTAKEIATTVTNATYSSAFLNSVGMTEREYKASIAENVNSIRSMIIPTTIMAVFFVLVSLWVVGYTGKKIYNS